MFLAISKVGPSQGAPSLHLTVSRSISLSFFVGLGEVAVRVVLLSCIGAGEEEIWSFGLEHPLRVQRVRLENICQAVASEKARDQTHLELSY